MNNPAAQRRREFLRYLSSCAAVSSLGKLVAEPPPPRNRIGVSTYSFWQFRNAEFRDIPTCMDAAARMGFDGVEILHVQMTEENEAFLKKLRRHAYLNSLDLIGFSTHQDFLDPDPEVRKQQVRHTRHQIELASALGIPSMRINTGRWGTSANFDALMAMKGMEPPLPGYDDETGFTWVIDSMGELLEHAEKNGVILGLENHWGLGRTAEGVLRVVNAHRSPWLKVTMDTGNFLENTYEQLEKIAPETVLVQTKTYFGGGRWYTLDIDYARVAKILAAVGYHGYLSLEFEGNAPVLEGISESLQLLRKNFPG